MESEEKTGTLELIKTYKKEFTIAILLGISVSISFSQQFYAYSFLLLTLDDTNKNQVKAANTWLFVFSIIELIGKTISIYFSLLTKRKTTFILGLIAILIGYGFIWLSKLFEVSKYKL